MNGLKRYWIEFDFKEHSTSTTLGFGCGITAFDNQDALNIFDAKIFNSSKRLPIVNIIEDIDIRTLDQNHVVVNMKSPHERGVWFPVGFD